MAYITTTDILTQLPEDTLIELTDDDGTGEINQTVVDQAIADADAEVDAYCGTKYAVPFATPHPILKKCSIDIAIKNIFARRVDELPEARRRAYDNTVRILRDIASGTISLGVDPEPAAKTEGGPATNITDRVFTKDSLENF